MKELFTIGEIAGLFGMNVRTLRYYDETGILIPEYTDQKTGYRYYSTKQFERLNTIKYLRALDMPLEKIKCFFENKDIDTMARLLREQQRVTRQKIENLRRIDRKIESRLNMLEDSAHSVLNRITEVRFPERKAAFLRKEIPVGDDLEYPIRELEQMHHLEALMFLGKVGVSIREEDLRRQEFGRFSGIFVFVEEEDNFEGDVFQLKESDYAVLRFSGTHTGADEYYKKLLEYLGGHGYRLNGNSVEVTLVDSGITAEEDKFVTELQVPFLAAGDEI